MASLISVACLHFAHWVETQCDAEMMKEESDMEGMSKEAIWKVVQQLQAGLQAREKQLERQGQQLASMQEVQHQLQVSLHVHMHGYCMGSAATSGSCCTSPGTAANLTAAQCLLQSRLCHMHAIFQHHPAAATSSIVGEHAMLGSAAWLPPVFARGLAQTWDAAQVNRLEAVSL